LNYVFNEEAFERNLYQYPIFYILKPRWFSSNDQQLFENKESEFLVLLQIFLFVFRNFDSDTRFQLHVVHMPEIAQQKTAKSTKSVFVER